MFTWSSMGQFAALNMGWAATFIQTQDNLEGGNGPE